MAIGYSRWLFIAALFGMVAIYFVTQTEVRVDPRPRGSLSDIETLSERSDLNVLFILIDTLRADRLGASGYSRATSPGLDYLASSGIYFTNHVAQSSWTKASMASLWTGLHPNRTGVNRATDGLSTEAKLPAEIFRDAGFVTAGIWRNGWVAPNFGMGQGFEIYQSPIARQAPESLRREVRAGRIEGTDIDLVFSAIEFLRTHRDQRFFLYVHMMDVHQYVSDAETAIFGSTYSDSYDNSVLWVDTQIRAIIGALDRLGLRENTLIAVAADHGEAFGEHGREGHARDLHQEVVRTPFILSPPFTIEPGLVVDTATANVDVWPTILDLVGLPALPLADGRSRTPEIFGRAAEDSADPPSDFAQLDRTWGRIQQDPSPIVAVRKGPHRLIHDVVNHKNEALYDLDSDPRGLLDISETNPEIVEQLTGEIEQYLKHGVAWNAGAPRVELDEMDLHQLRALGYAVEQ
jgi:arylsulfatase A-like enzyme